MARSSKITRIVAAVAAAGGACLVVAVNVAPASASGTYTVSPSGTTTVTVTNITNPTTGSANLVFTDTTPLAKPKMTCTGFSATGSAVGGSYSFLTNPYPGSDAGLTSPASTTPTGTSFSGCSNMTLGAGVVGPLNTPWSLGCTAYTFSSGTTVNGCTGYLYPKGTSNPNLASVTATSASCTFNASGAVYGTYTNPVAPATNGTFVSDPTNSSLTVNSVTGSSCSLVHLANGDKANLSSDGTTTAGHGAELSVSPGLVVS